jgi:hypothetical protein
MGEDVGAGLWLLLGLVVVIMVVSGLTMALRKGDGEEHDIEHLDHETRGDSTGH